MCLSRARVCVKNEGGRRVRVHDSSNMNERRMVSECVAIKIVSLHVVVVAVVVVVAIDTRVSFIASNSKRESKQTG